ncbi:hypothetical protein BGZ74_003509, partial [Mortierella antarctica]
MANSVPVVLPHTHFCVDTSLTLAKNINLLRPLPDAIDPIKDVLGAPTSALWSADDFYHGFTPVMLATTWRSLFKVALSVAEAVAHKFVK